MNKIFTSILLILITSITYAQNYPVQSNMIIIPPYSVYLSDYASISSEKMIVNLMLKDINQSNLPIKLRIRIKGQGIELVTSESYQPLPILLQGGIPVQISGTDLENYLNPTNLDFSGISRQQFIKTGKLPEGIYQFCVEAIEYRRNILISNTGCTMAWLMLNDPPRFLLPESNSTLTATNPQNLFFTWMPMNTGSPNSAFTTEYEFTLVEVWPDNRNPNDAINSMMPLYQTTTMNTAITYGPAEPPLVPGRKYVCRLRAYDTEGRDLFKNNGYSQILTFTFGQECLPPTNIKHNIENYGQVKTNWQTLPGQTKYRLSYSEENTDGSWSAWYHNETILPYSTITELKAEHTYRYMLMAACGAIESEYSEPKEFTTPKIGENEIECGKDLSIPPIDDSLPLENLNPGDKINVGGFVATIIELEGANGIFTGKCVVNVKTFGVRVLSEFSNININQSMQVTAGEINAVKGELKLFDLNGFLDSLNRGTGNNEEITNLNDSIFVYNLGDSIIVTLGGEDFIITGDTTIITAGGDTIITDFGLIPPIIIVNGDTTIINDNEIDLDRDNPDGGNVTEVVSDSTLYAINHVKFKEYENPTGINFGFDEYPPDIPQYLSEYEKGKVLEQDYIVPWQSVEATGKHVFVNMLVKTKVPDSINTRLKVEMNGMPLNFTTSTDKDTIRILNVTGQEHKNKELITAYYLNDEEKEIPVGYLNLISYERQNFNLVIIPVDGAFNYSENLLQTYLNKVYAPAITSWEVQVADQLVVDYDEDEKNGLNTSRSFLSSFNQEMNTVIDACKDRADYKKDKATYYLFVMDKAENESLNGLMPFNSHFGFLFTGDKPTETKLFRTIAHELGHGAFKLKHNFDDKGTEKYTTQNLMDYTNSPETATILRKFQWKEIIDPRLIAFGWSEEFYSETVGKNIKNVRIKCKYGNNTGNTKDFSEQMLANSETLYLIKPMNLSINYVEIDGEKEIERWKSWYFNDEEDPKYLFKKRIEITKDDYTLTTDVEEKSATLKIKCKISKDIFIYVMIHLLDTETELPSIVKEFTVDLKNKIEDEISSFRTNVEKGGIEWNLIAGTARESIYQYAGFGMSKKFKMEDKFLEEEIKIGEEKEHENLKNHYQDLMLLDAKIMNLHDFIKEKDGLWIWDKGSDTNIKKIEKLKEFISTSTDLPKAVKGEDEAYSLAKQYLMKFLKITEIIEDNEEE